MEGLLRRKVLYQEEVSEAILEENLCLDTGYVGGLPVTEFYGYIAHIRPRNEEVQMKEKTPGFKARRWVVESAFSWLKRWREVAPRYEKTLLSYLGIVALSIAMHIFKRII